MLILPHPSFNAISNAFSIANISAENDDENGFNLN
jgi:hypothetical protein